MILNLKKDLRVFQKFWKDLKALIDFFNKIEIINHIKKDLMLRNKDKELKYYWGISLEVLNLI